MSVKRDQITGAILVAVGLVVLWLVSRFSIDIQPGQPGPKLFPLIAVAGFLICGVGIFVQATLSKTAEKVFLSKEGWLRVAVTLALLAAYVAAMQFLGYLIVTPFALFALCTLFSRGKGSKLLWRVVFSLAFTAVIYVIYIYVFGLTLPGLTLF